MALIAVHLGIVDESSIEDMSYLFFSDVLTELGHKLNYDGIVNFAGNPYASKAWDMIVENNPMTAGGEKSVVKGMVGLFNQSKVVKTKRGEGRKYSWDEPAGEQKTDIKNEGVQE